MVELKWWLDGVSEGWGGVMSERRKNRGMDRWANINDKMQTPSFGHNDVRPHAKCALKY
jgi:hypothetical protein